MHFFFNHLVLFSTNSHDNMGMGESTILAYSWPTLILLSLQTKSENPESLNVYSRIMIDSMGLPCFQLFVRNSPLAFDRVHYFSLFDLEDILKNLIKVLLGHL